MTLGRLLNLVLLKDKDLLLFLTAWYQDKEQIGYITKHTVNSMLMIQLIFLNKTFFMKEAVHWFTFWLNLIETGTLNSTDLTFLWLFPQLQKRIAMRISKLTQAQYFAQCLAYSKY